MTGGFIPAYLRLEKGELITRVACANEHLEACDLCAWDCGVNRRVGKLGVCQTGERAKISSYAPHLGEEDPLRGWRGSGTVFFTSCNLHCQYCQNYDISQTDNGQDIEPERLAAIFLELQAYGCHNINFVSPSHVVPQILSAVLNATQAGLKIPLVYNTGGYDSLSALQLLDGIVDIYMPDMKYASAQIGLHYSKIRNYPAVNQSAVLEMHRQVGDLQINERGIATRGLLVRHLVLPNQLAGTETIVNFLAKEISTDTYLNLMDQYRPAYKASQYPKLNRPVTHLEIQQALELTRESGLHRLDRRK
jgi:putative pyruvate formate lyase activating enzyme